MKQAILSLIVFTSLTGNGQTFKPLQKVLIGFNFSPDYCFRTLNNNAAGSYGDAVILGRNNIEIPKFGYTAGFDLIFPLTTRFGFETGLQFTNKGYSLRKQSWAPDPTDPRRFQIGIFEL